MALEPSFTVDVEDGIEPASRLLVGFADIGAAAITALDLLVGQLEIEQIGSIGTRNLPDVTPAHPPGPDFDAAGRLVDGVEALYGIDVDERELQRCSEEVRRYYRELIERLQSLRGSDQPAGSRDFPEDRMYM